MLLFGVRRCVSKVSDILLTTLASAIGTHKGFAADSRSAGVVLEFLEGERYDFTWKKPDSKGHGIKAKPPGFAACLW